MKIYTIEVTDKIDYEPTYQLNIAFRSKRKAKRYISEQKDREDYNYKIAKCILK